VTVLYLALLYREEGRPRDADAVLRQAAPLAHDYPERPAYRLWVAAYDADRALLAALVAQAEPAASESAGLPAGPRPAEPAGRPTDLAGRGAAARLTAAGARLREAVARMRAAVAADPAVSDYQVVLSVYLTWHGRLQHALGRTGEADALFGEALTFTEKLARDYPHSLSFQAAPLPAQIHRAALAGDEGRPRDALDACDRARDGVGAALPVSEPLRRFPAARGVSRARAGAVRVGPLRRGAGRLGRIVGRGRGALQGAAPGVPEALRLGAGAGRRHGSVPAPVVGSRVLTETRRDGCDAAPRLRDLYAKVPAEATAYQQGELLSGGVCGHFALVHAASSSAAAADDRLPPAERPRLAEQSAVQAVSLLRRAALAVAVAAVGDDEV
jgi:hypothetical protein